MTREEVAARLQGFFASKAPVAGKLLTESTRLREEWRLSSLSILEAVAFIEDEFEVSMTQVDINPTHFATLGSLADFVTERMR